MASHPISKTLQSLSDQQPRRLAIDMDNSPAWLAVDHCATDLGWVIVPMPHFFSIKQRQHLLQQSGVDVVCCDEPRMTWWLSQGFQPVKQHAIAAGAVCCLQRPVTQQPPLPDGTHKITFTSGTTSEPKGVCLGLDHLQQVGRSLAEATAHLGLSKHLSLLPYSVLLENVAVHQANQFAGLEVVAVPLAEVGLTGSGQLDTAVMLAAIRQHRPDSLIMMPQMLKQLVMHLLQQPQDLSFIRFIAVGGAVCAPQLLQQAKALGLPVHQGYGISECGSVVCLERQPTSQGSVGQPLAHAQLSLAEDGEVLIHGPQFLGYLGAANDNNQGDAMVFASGDIGHLDDQGQLHISGRKKHLIINSFGRNILPDWIEGELLAIPELMQAVVCGEGQPFLTALCVTPMSQSALDDAVQTMNDHLPDYAQVKVCIKVPPFTPQNQQLTASGKPRRAHIFNHYHNLLESAYASSHSPQKIHAL